MKRITVICASLAVATIGLLAIESTSPTPAASQEQPGQWAQLPTANSPTPNPWGQAQRQGFGGRSQAQQRHQPSIPTPQVSDSAWNQAARSWGGQGQQSVNHVQQTSFFDRNSVRQNALSLPNQHQDQNAAQSLGGNPTLRMLTQQHYRQLIQHGYDERSAMAAAETLARRELAIAESNEFNARVNGRRGAANQNAGNQAHPSQQTGPQPSQQRRPAWQSGFSDRQVQAQFQQRGNSGVVTAYAAQMPRGRVRANHWKGPMAKPIRPIQHVEYVYQDVDQAFVESTPDDLLNPYDQRATTYPDQISLPIVPGQVAELSGDYQPWWTGNVVQSMRGGQQIPVNVESLILKAVENSPQVIAMRIDPIIRETEVLEEEAAFDWLAFLETEYDDISEPIGDTLISNNTFTRYEDSKVVGRAGLKKKFDQGAQFDIAQQFGYEDSNSLIFSPADQGTARLELNFAQPLLRGAGRAYNRGRIVLAAINRNMSEDEVQAKLQDHLVSVYETYWALYRARAIKLQKQLLLQKAVEIQTRLQARQGIDTVKRQVYRANAAVAARRSEIVRAEMAIRNAESRLRLLVNSPELKEAAQFELLPAEHPRITHFPISLKASIETSLRNRPEISRAIRQMKATSLRLGIAKNELLPKLDLALGMYTAGLRSRGRIGRAFERSFDTARPSFSVGLFFEVPLGNRRALAQNERREWEVAKAFRQFEAAVEAGMTEVELAARQMETAYQEMLSRFQAMESARAEADFLLKRWKALGDGDRTVSFLLEDLLDAQERVAEQEASFVNAQIEYVMAIVNLKRAMGVLVDCNYHPTISSSAAPDSPESFNGPTPVAPGTSPDAGTQPDSFDSFDQFDDGDDLQLPPPIDNNNPVPVPRRRQEARRRFGFDLFR